MTRKEAVYLTERQLDIIIQNLLDEPFLSVSHREWAELYDYLTRTQNRMHQ